MNNLFLRRPCSISKLVEVDEHPNKLHRGNTSRVQQGLGLNSKPYSDDSDDEIYIWGRKGRRRKGWRGGVTGSAKLTFHGGFPTDCVLSAPANHSPRSSAASWMARPSRRQDAASHSSRKKPSPLVSSQTEHRRQWASQPVEVARLASWVY
ncbi:hypothetical protein CPC08DRAFT_706254 [Agrocybe pediades]|nr:hypothetical protein CPC08DRAFT_706254 [Agrocybe pediades]